METRLLETFKAVVDLRSATSAAAALGVTQPAVSSQIARLEELVGFRLFARDGGPLSPTPEGLLFYAEATKALNGLNKLTQSVEQIRGATAGRLVIASHPSAAISLLPPIVAAFVSVRPDVEIRLVTRSSDVVSRLLPSESFDIAIAEPPIDEVAYYVERFRLRCVVLLPANHRLSRRQVVAPPDLAGEPCIETWRAAQVSRHMRAVFAAAGADLNVRIATEFFASACGLVAGGAGFTLVDKISAAAVRNADVVVIQFEPAVYYDICVFHAPGLSKLATAFLDLLRARLNALAACGVDS